jgi:hypothetical protein
VSIGSYLTRIASFGWNCARKVNSTDIPIYAGCLAFFYFGIFLLPTHKLFADIFQLPLKSKSSRFFRG